MTRSVFLRASPGAPRFWYAQQEPAWKRVLLFPLEVASWIFAAGVVLRRAAFRAGLFRWRRAGVRVISVGNLVVGGAGKTPVVIHLARALAARGRRVAVLSRGYGRLAVGPRVVGAGATADEVGDEPLVVKRRCPEAVVLVGENRAALAEVAVRTHGAEDIVLDDGFQHFALQRDLDIVVVDGLGNGRLLPRGPLREPASALGRADLVWGPDGAVESRLVLDAPEAVRGKRVLAVAGIARPERFRATLDEAGALIAGELFYPDHHRYPARTMHAIAARAHALGCEAVATTEKDAVKLPAEIGGVPVVAVPVRVEIVRGAEVLERALAEAAPRPGPVPRSRVLEALGAALAGLVWLLGIRKRIMLDNLTRAFPDRGEAELRALARANLRHLGRSLGEAVLARRHGDEAFIDGAEAMARGAEIRRGGGLVVAVSHFGNWELFGHWAARRLKVSAITRRLKGRLNAAIHAARREAGLRELPERGSAADAVRALREGHVLAVIVDQNMPPEKGIFVEFFGRPASTTPAAAVLARRADVPLVAVFVVRGPDGRHRVQVEGPFDTSDTRACTQALTATVEQYVRDHPEQWFWLHRRWKTRPP